MGVNPPARPDRPPRPARPAVLAIDAGNSKTDAALIAADGTVLGTGRSGGFQPPLTGVEAAVDVLGRAVAEAVEAAARAPSVPGAPYAEQVSACLANADLPVEERQLTEAIGARGWGARTRVFNDTFAILRAGLTAAERPRGVAVVCGAGINCVGMRPDGRTARFPALGQISGDWGGGGGLAAEALWWAARAEDGRGGPTELAAALPGHFGLGSMAELIEALHLGTLAHGRTHELVPVLFSVAAAGDAAASAIVERQADEVVALASVALTRLELLEEETPVLLGGGVLTAGHEQLDRRIAVELARRAPHARVSVVSAPPVLGAGLLGLDALGALPEAHGKLRAHFG
ncbi:N-acetylglucosamine kinase [Streptomyces roseus]|uniref:ATPase n=1 Tax=Streptomyces roseus TaxID=66430 RepID=A0A0J6XKR0_9ACTN|nr:BadF/BadG/BcrA/BcrD ATPase family protein [Streptomyces roseus]KMO94837.1 ATPase [Streptomyces roseus]